MKPVVPKEMTKWLMHGVSLGGFVKVHARNRQNPCLGKRRGEKRQRGTTISAWSHPLHDLTNWMSGNTIRTRLIPSAPSFSLFYSLMNKQLRVNWKHKWTFVYSGASRLINWMCLIVILFFCWVTGQKCPPQLMHFNNSLSSSVLLNSLFAAILLEFHS